MFHSFESGAVSSFLLLESLFLRSFLELFHELLLGDQLNVAVRLAVQLRFTHCDLDLVPDLKTYNRFQEVEANEFVQEVVQNLSTYHLALLHVRLSSFWHSVGVLRNLLGLHSIASWKFELGVLLDLLLKVRYHLLVCHC